MGLNATYDTPDSLCEHGYHVWPSFPEPWPFEEYPRALVNDSECEVERRVYLALLSLLQTEPESLVYRGRVRSQFTPATGKASEDGS